jgi:membrane peptidoglycan carboxypeptidase
LTARRKKPREEASEISRAIRLEKKLSKEQILELF